MNKNMFIKDIISNFQDNDLSIDERKSLIFYEFYKYLINENKKYNLTTIVDPRDVIKKHFLDSVLPLVEIQKKIKNFNYDNYENIIDFGCGAGFPLMPYLIYLIDQRSKLNFSYIFTDSNKKKIAFISKFISNNNFLNNFDISCIQTRLENLYNKNFKHQNTLVIGRAITNFNQLIKYIFEFIKLNSISKLSFVYLVGPNFIKPNMDLLKCYFGTKYEIYYDSYHYEYDSKTIKRGIFYLEVKKSLQIRS